MSFDERIMAIIQRLPSLIEHVQTEEATKNALVMPFIAALGYDVFNPQEVVPEFVADVGLKKGEKVDYAIKRDGEVILLFECKKVQTDLSQAEMSQLFRYFAVTKARIAVLTNGVQYWFYSDLEAPNKMDERPFLELNLADPRASDLTEVRRLAKDQFDLEKMLSAANELKYLSVFKKLIASQFESPEEDLARIFFSKAAPGSRFNAAARDMAVRLLGKAFQQFISERVSDRLKAALQSETKVTSQAGDGAPPPAAPAAPEKDAVVTTEDELDAFRVVRAILCRMVPPERIALRDAKTYCSVLLDDNNRRPICRLWFNGKQKYLGVFGAEKEETRIPISDVADIYQHAESLLGTLGRYEAERSSN